MGQTRCSEVWVCASLGGAKAGAALKLGGSQALQRPLSRAGAALSRGYWARGEQRSPGPSRGSSASCLHEIRGRSSAGCLHEIWGRSHPPPTEEMFKGLWVLGWGVQSRGREEVCPDPPVCGGRDTSARFFCKDQC